MFKLTKTLLFICLGTLAVSSCSKEIAPDPVKIVISFAADTNGQVTPKGIQTGDAGSILSSVAQANKDYRIQGWYDGNKKLSTSGDFTLIGDSVLQVRLTENVANKIFTAKFSDKEYTAKINTILSPEGGQITPKDSSSAVVNNNITFSATLKPGYTVLWYDYKRIPITSKDEESPFHLSNDGLQLYIKSSEAIDGKTFTAEFKLADCTVNFKAEANGSVDPETQTAPKGDFVTSVAKGTSVYDFEGWYNPQGEKITSTSGDIYVDGTTIHVKTYSELGTDTFVAKFYRKYKVEFNVEGVEGGTISREGEEDVYSGSKIESNIATVTDGYEFLGWFDGDTKITTTASDQPAYLTAYNRLLNVKVSADKKYTAKFRQVDAAIPTEEYGVAAPRIFAVGSGDDTKLMLSRVNIKDVNLFQFGSIVSWPGDDNPVSTPSFNPSNLDVSKWDPAWSVGSSFPNPSAENLKNGKGDPCQLVG
ncbi:MAG: InlB B-repeat-containing protein, partial [Phocaeicola sp.]